MKIDLRVRGRGERSIDVRRLVVAGFTGRDEAAVQRHIDELMRDGIAAPPEVPALYVLPVGLLTTADAIDVEGDRTSGEVEPVIFVTDDGAYVGVGSDHTDRLLEREDIYTAKAACPKVVSRDVVPIEDIDDRWDDLVVRSQRGLYQQSTLRELLPPGDVLSRVGDVRNAVVFLGTVALLTGGFVFAEEFAAELVDTNGSVISACTYRVRVDGAERLSLNRRTRA